MIGFCTTCKGRTQHLAQTLPKNIEDNKHSSTPHKFIVLNYNDQDGMMEYMKTNHSKDIESGKVVLYTYRGSPVFQMAHAKNLSHRLAIIEGCDILVNVDADNYIGNQKLYVSDKITGKEDYSDTDCFADYIDNKFKEDNIFLWSKMIKEGPDKLPRGISGRIAVTKNAFLNVGGYDEKFKTWSPDDKDFNTRLRNAGYIAHEVDKRYLSGVPHNDKMRFKEYPHAQAEQTGEEFTGIEYSKETIANWGNFGCGVVTRNFDDTPIQLKPLPTRIFGIGMHKTGTTSLHEALKILGFDSAHWKSAHWAKAIWNEVKSNGRSSTLEKSYAVTDLPITLLYKELDKAYPNSKFILTTRNEDKWLESVKNHWNPDINPFRAGWDSDPFTHKIHRELYGMKNFHAETFLNRFRKHNAEVKEYFGNSNNNNNDRLLIMDLNNNPNWEALCNFFNLPIPNVPYPKRFVNHDTDKQQANKSTTSNKSVSQPKKVHELMYHI